MNNFTKSLLVSSIFIFCVSSIFSQAKREYFTNVKVNASWVQDPDIQAGSAVIKGANPALRWLQIDVDYNTILPKSKKTGWLDNVVFKYDILLPAAATKEVAKNRIVISGTVQYWSIAMDGQEHHAQAFVHPRILQRYASLLRMRKSELKELRILVTMMVNQSRIGWGVYKMKSSTKTVEVAQMVQGALNALQTIKLKGMIFGRNKTPWGVLNTSYYDLIKEKE